MKKILFLRLESPLRYFSAVTDRYLKASDHSFINFIDLLVDLEYKNLIYDLATWGTRTETVGRTLQNSKIPGIHPEILIIHLAVQKA